MHHQDMAELGPVHSVSRSPEYQDLCQMEIPVAHLLMLGEVLGKRVIQQPLEDYCG